MPDNVIIRKLDNGLTLLMEPMRGVRSAALSIVVPGGTSTEAEGNLGVAAVVNDWITRGAGDRDNRALTDHLDGLGLQRSNSVGVYHARLNCLAESSRVVAGLPAYADMLRGPKLPEDGFEAARDLGLQALDGLEDDPRQKVLIELSRRHFPAPLGRSRLGEPADLEALTPASAKTQFTRTYTPTGAMISVAGAIDPAGFEQSLRAVLGDWNGPAVPLPVKPATPPPAASPVAMHHILADSGQTHIGIAWPAIQENHPDYYAMRLACEVLSGGMSGRLFTEVREKRALCYSVWAGYTALKGTASMMGYAGTSNDRAQATLDCFMEQVILFSKGVTEAELSRARVGLKSSIIMQGESTGARAAAITGDYWSLGRVRTLEEIVAALDAVTLTQINNFLATNVPGPFDVVTVGPKGLDIPAAARL